MEKPAVMKILENAQMAHEAGDFLGAARFYEEFFDQSRLVDPMAFYAIRLNNCLMGWKQLADDFPGARMKLADKAQEMLALYETEKSPERFHDYWVIKKLCGELDEAIATFEALAAQTEVAPLAKFVWTDLVANARWPLCGSLLTRPEQKLDELFAVFDQACGMKQLDPQFDTLAFDEHIVETLLADTKMVVEVLRQTDRSSEVDSLARQFQQLVSQRQHATLAKQVSAQGAYLFIGH
ncbi:MAG: hypothetical protein AAF197_01120 [Pseudomonadota bacterium]